MHNARVNGTKYESERFHDFLLVVVVDASSRPGVGPRLTRQICVRLFVLTEESVFQVYKQPRTPVVIMWLQDQFNKRPVSNNELVILNHCCSKFATSLNNTDQTLPGPSCTVPLLKGQTARLRHLPRPDIWGIYLTLRI